MLGSLLKASSYGNIATSNEPKVPTPTSYATATTDPATTSGSLVGGNSSHHEDFLVAPPMLDHVPDDLKYKLFASKNIPFSSLSSPSCAIFRILVAEETGRMCRNNYKVVMDFSTAKGQQMDQIRPNELKEYIFGSPIRSADLSQGNKFRTIPNSGLVLITRVFFTDDPSWNNRLTVSLCVPTVLLPIIPEAWQHITRWLDQCQSIVLDIWSKSKSVKCKNYQDGVLPSNLNVHFRYECDTIVQLLQGKLIPCLRSFMEIPRMFLYPQNYQKFIKSWFKDIFSWIEIKDGPRMNFLPALLGKIICDFKDCMNDSETTRIVVISGNMVVANKLLFIISGLLEPKYKGKIKFMSQSESSDNLPQHMLHNPLPKRDSFKKGHYNGSGINCTNNIFTSTNKGWEIPRNNSRNSMVSVSSNEQLAEVIQPSSLKSGSNSLQYLSSSLSSHNGPSSYGSWFSKITGSQASPSLAPKNIDQWDRISAPIGTPGSITSQQHFGRGTGMGLTPQPSPSISEYEEFPWMGTPSSPRAGNDNNNSSNNTHSMRRSSFNGAPLGEIKITRDCQRIDQGDVLDEAFTRICKPGFEISEGEYEVIPGDSRHAAFMQIDMNSQILRQGKPLELLPRYTNYLAKFNHWFKLQGFPVGSESESRVIYTMRKDLQVSDSSRTLLVSLRSREIKEITIMRNDSNERTNNRHGIVQKTKKIFNNGKCGNISSRLLNCIAFVNASIQRAMALYDDAELLQEQTDHDILDVFESLLCYNKNS
ncbi:ZYRO0G18744p [Zygosaccharomyces rouxii]|uniref:Protein LST4 n=1 Tax=Zygosaccharomyces rouxii (strain ATCC 2623 / CBS 732 / NBRC 1130 / NCYC 568 / NRRL Y-229) TaxID=559307 RepID=C5E178_ZYGRC|nr:uncharacterized protein ZYRO0G18744g [Zygosaccharomyces rouxii]KAH9202855.1 hypothetical protein LQ764DRAFT_207810 [Zygosaccharomyces rouxii]CAR29862.1 ZYRO0G18744p [Zygosaccharomyces rouxii]